MGFILIMERINDMQNPTQGGRPVLMRSDMHEYQNRAVKFILLKKNVALFVDMGL